MKDPHVRMRVVTRYCARTQTEEYHTPQEAYLSVAYDMLTKAGKNTWFSAGFGPTADAEKKRIQAFHKLHKRLARFLEFVDSRNREKTAEDLANTLRNFTAPSAFDWY